MSEDKLDSDYVWAILKNLESHSEADEKTLEKFSSIVKACHSLTLTEALARLQSPARKLSAAEKAGYPPCRNADCTFEAGRQRERDHPNETRN